MFMDRLGSDIQLVPTQTDITAEDLAYLFFDKWYCKNGLLADIISDRDKLFMSQFWKALHKLTGVKLKLSTAYHPEMDSSSKHTNKTINQALRYHVERNQLGWVCTLLHIHFDMMNTFNKSTGFTPFQLHFGQSLRVILLLVPAKPSATVADIDAWHVIWRLELDMLEVQDNLLKAKISQSLQANKQHLLSFPFSIGSRVHLSTLHQRKEYTAKGEQHVARFMPCFNGPYTIIDIDKQHSTVMLDLPNSPNIHPTFHTSKVLPYIESDITLFPSCCFKEPNLITIDDGNEEYYIDHILDARHCGQGYQYLVWWQGYSQEHDGYQDLNCKTVRPWMPGWHLGVGLLELSRFSFCNCQLVAFSHRVLTHLALRFYLHFY